MSHGQSSPQRHKQRVRRLEQSRDQWKQRVTDLEAEVARLKAANTPWSKPWRS